MRTGMQWLLALGQTKLTTKMICDTCDICRSMCNFAHLQCLKNGKRNKSADSPTELLIAYCINSLGYLNKGKKEDVKVTRLVTAQTFPGIDKAAINSSRQNNRHDFT